MHIVSDLEAGLLISINILRPKSAIVDIKFKKIIFLQCKSIKVPVESIAKAAPRIYKVLAAKHTTILPLSAKYVQIRGKQNLPTKYNFEFWLFRKA